MENSFLNRFLFFTVLLMAVFWAVDSKTDPDLFGHTKYGLDMLEQGKILRNDIYSYSFSGAEWTNHEWLSEITFGAVYKHAGFNGMLFLKIVITLLASFFIFRIISLYASHVFERAVLFLVIAFLMTAYTPVMRPQNFSHLFTLIYFYLFAKITLSREEKISIPLMICFPVIMAVWVNLHGGFLSGLGLLAIFLIGHSLDRRRLDLRLFFVFLIAFLCTLINPYGYKLYTYLYADLFVPRICIVEWECLDPSFVPQWIYIGFCLIVLALSNKKKSFTQMLLFFSTLYLGCRYIKFFPFFLISTVMIMPSFVEDLLRNQFKILSENPRPLRRMQKVILVLAFLFLSLTIMVKVSRSFSNPYPIEKDCYPVDAVNYMKQNNVKGNLLVNFNWAQYMIWEMYPACKVCYDGRHRTIYPLSIEKEYFKFHFMNGEWDRILDSYPPDFIIWQADMPHAKLLKDKIEWEEIYADKEAVILRRKNKSRL